MMRLSRSLRAVLITAGMAGLTLTACDMDQKTYLSQNRLRVEQSRYDAEVPVAAVNDAFYQALAQEYKSSGGDGLYLTFVYNPESGGVAAMTASERAGQAAQKLRSQGVAAVKADILPVADDAHSGKVLISYTKYAAHAPQDCKAMPGLKDRQVELGWDYRYGCSLDEQIAEQVAHPADLLGNDTVPETSSGRRAAVMSARHQGGLPNEPLKTDSITDMGD